MKNSIAALISGIIFGLGLAVSEMINPTRVINFLDITGTWDYTLALVMGGALAVTVIGFPLVMRRSHPLFTEKFHLPTRSDIDSSLLGGAALFGIGWGLAGLCPGPALAGLASLSPSIFMFVAAMIVGQIIGGKVQDMLAK
ncbi:MAG: DUF6691 family protein [Pseudohongiellaceae bacterium]|nr:DUF6691 family protein [Pseudohongiellaceae bacterium]